MLPLKLSTARRVGDTGVEWILQVDISETRSVFSKDIQHSFYCAIVMLVSRRALHFGARRPHKERERELRFSGMSQVLER